MKQYSSKISLTKNSRGIYGLDTSMGCSSGMSAEDGCYNDCYAARSAKIYGYDFGKTVLRFFESKKHEQQIIDHINKIKMPFVRIGCSGDPSENWEHTVDILKIISRCNKEIVIITRHWTNLTDEHLCLFTKMNLCINTSVSALDKPELLSNSLHQYNRIKHYCKSVLRIVSCSFNLENETGHRLHKLQAELFKNNNTLDTVFRPSKNNPLIVDGIINVKPGLFMGKKQLMSKYDSNVYTGKCSTCHEMCGLNINTEKISYPDRKGILKQLSLFKKKMLAA